MTNVYRRLVDAIKAMPPVPKNGWNNYHRFSYRTVDDIIETARKSLAAQGLAMFPSEVEVVSSTTVTTQRGDAASRIVIRTHWTVASVDGDTLTLQSLGEGIDKDDKAASKAMTFSVKSALSQLMMIAGEADPDGGAPDVRHDTAQPAAAAPAAATPIEKEPTPGQKLEKWLLGQTENLAPEMKDAVIVSIKDTLAAAGYTKARDVTDLEESRRIATDIMADIQQITAS